MTSMDQIEVGDGEDSGSAAPKPLLNRIDRAAVFLMLLSDEEAAALLSRMDPAEVEMIGAAMCELGEIDRAAMAEALEDFVTESTREVLARQDRGAQVRALLERSIGPAKTQSMMLRIEPETKVRGIEIARWLAPPVLLKLVEEEHPQVIAALLLMLEPEPAAEVLSGLPTSVQPLVVERIARIGPVSQQAIDMIESLLSQKIGASFGVSTLTIGGPREAANLINLAAGDMRGHVLPAIAQRDGALAERIEEEMFTFEMLFDLDRQAMERLLRDVETENLVDALKGLKEDERTPFFAAMSIRAADGIRDEIDLRGRLARSEVLAAQRKIVEVARALADQGEIIMGADDGEFV